MVSKAKTHLKLPNHIAIIMDGNRRWAKERELPSLEGHRRGADNFEILADKVKELGIKCLTVWAFSTENWKRSEDEKTYLFDLIRQGAKKYQAKTKKEKTRFIHLGRKDRLPEDIVKILEDTEESTKDYTDFTLAMGIDYGGHDELVRTVEKIENNKQEVNFETIGNNLDTASLPQIDLIIRTGGEKRLSGFMSWQCAYAELYFVDMYFPDFGIKQLEGALENFSQRERRFGGD
jgi:undecaprenyl diphosphate synthase